MCNHKQLLAMIIGILLILCLIVYLTVSFCKNVLYETFINYKSSENMNNIFGYANKYDPYVKPLIVNNICSLEKCKEIINYCTDKLSDSEIVGGKHLNIRNSQQHWILKSNTIAQELIEKVSKMVNMPFENAEDLQVVRYLPNQYYNEHHDACCDNNEKCQEFIKRGGQRILTVLIYLNSEFENGETYFKNLNIKMKTTAGNAIVFYPLQKNNQNNISNKKCHPYALHAGLPVKSGVKWIANIWFRENKFV